MSDTSFLIESARLGFRLLDDGDFEDLVKLDTDPEIRAHFPEGISTPEEIRERIARNRRSYSERGFCDFALIDKETGHFVGRAGFGELDDGEIEAGYVLLKEYWNRGLAQESLRALLAWAVRSLNVPRILAYAPTQHAASIHVMEKCGMRYLRTDEMRGMRCVFYEYRLRPPFSGR